MNVQIWWCWRSKSWRPKKTRNHLRLMCSFVLSTSPKMNAWCVDSRWNDADRSRSQTRWPTQLTQMWSAETGSSPTLPIIISFCSVTRHSCEVTHSVKPTTASRVTNADRANEPRPTATNGKFTATGTKHFPVTSISLKQLFDQDEPRTAVWDHSGTFVIVHWWCTNSRKASLLLLIAQF